MCYVVWQKFTSVSGIFIAFIIFAHALMMAAVGTSETSVILYQTTRRNIPEDSHLQKYKTSYAFMLAFHVAFLMY
jgi:hypothetical protein